MSKTWTGLLCLVAGLVLGSVGGTVLAGGTLAGAGAAAGITTGVCATIQSARNADLLSEAEADTLLDQMAKDFSNNNIDEGVAADSAKECSDFMAK
ncbi:hypothetical protein [Croceicoccus gelatinilyticus]|uniref:hypothetical protein n=1 Tax=Croceicoccus gelatinilyticus TaxID=2835536 RepID=UPI001BD0D913|nr:hypothetical protein [Croceicoccus gelatinilyticus]MBS7671169.1 hypothetical protein [Croceicoccus gelatinilyticus]